MECTNYADRVVEKLWNEFKNVALKESSKGEYVLQEKCMIFQLEQIEKRFGTGLTRDIVKVLFF